MQTLGMTNHNIWRSYGTGGGNYWLFTTNISNYKSAKFSKELSYILFEIMRPSVFEAIDLGTQRLKWDVLFLLHKNHSLTPKQRKRDWKLWHVVIVLDTCTIIGYM